MSAQIIVLPSGRHVLNTGKVQIGLRYNEPPATPRVLDWRTHRPPLSGGTNDDRPRPSEPSKPPADWLDDRQLQREMAQRDAEALEYLCNGLDRLVMLARWIIGAVAVGVIAWLAWTA